MNRLCLPGERTAQPRTDVADQRETDLSRPHPQDAGAREWCSFSGY